MAEPYYRTSMPAPSWGVNNSNDIFSILPTQVYRAVNCHLDESGILYTRGGCRLLNSTVLDGKVTSIYDYWRPEGSSQMQVIFVTAGIYLYKLNVDNNTFEQVKELSVDDRPVWATFYDGNGNPNAVMCNGTDFFRYDGVGFVDIDFNGDTGTKNPRYILAYDDRMLAAGMDDAPYDVYISDTLDCTDWAYGVTPSAQNWSVNSTTGNRITGLAIVYNFAAIFQRDSISIITEADVTSTTSEQITVSRVFGTTSHWSIQTIGNMIYFADENHLYRGELRQAVENGLEVKPVDRNIRRKYRSVKSFDDIVSVYDKRTNEIYWGTECLHGSGKDTALVYSIEHSGQKADMGWIDVWSGWWEGKTKDDYNPHAYSVVLNSDRVPEVWRGDQNGYVYIHEEMHRAGTYKYDKDYNASTAADIQVEIVTGAVIAAGISTKKRLAQYTPIISQFVNDSTYIQWIIDGSYINPDTTRYLKHKGNIPYWNDTSKTSTTTLFGGSIWANNEYIVTPVEAHEPFRYLQLRIVCAGANDRDHIRYAGGELLYQVNHLTHALQG